MKKILYVTLAFVFIFLISYAAGAEKIKVKTVNGVKVIENPKNPVPPEGIPAKLTIKEDLTIGEGETEEEMFSEMIGIDVDKEGNMYILDNKECKIKVFDSKGKYVRSFGEKGQGPGEMSYPIQIKITQKNELFVEDIMSQRLAFFSLDGKFLRNFSMTKELGLSFIVFDSQGNIIGQQIIPSEKKLIREVKKYDKELKPLFTLASIDNTSLLEGKINPFRVVLLYDLGKDDTIFLSNPEEYEIKVFNAEGKLIKRILKEYDPVKVTKEDKDEFFERLPAEAAPVKDRIEFPKFYPAYQSFILDEEGRIFVRTFEKGKEKGEYFYDVFDAEGRYITKVLLDVEPRAWKEEKLYAIKEDEDGFKVLKRYSVLWEK